MSQNTEMIRIGENQHLLLKVMSIRAQQPMTTLLNDIISLYAEANGYNALEMESTLRKRAEDAIRTDRA